MKTVGIIAEYNPFHNGHKYHISEAKKAAKADCAVVVMSPDFVQRGEPAMFSKHIRAKWALQNGADMVIALPAPFSLAPAEIFALAGVQLLSKSGIVDSVCFGSECGDTELLKKAASLAQRESDELSSLIRTNLDSGLSHPESRSKAYAQIYGDELGSVFSSPNDILGLEYIRANQQLPQPMEVVALRRKAVSHDSLVPGEGFASASYIRQCIRENRISELSSYLPENVFSDIQNELSSHGTATFDGLSREISYALRRMTKDEIAALPDVSEGLENPLYSACRKCSTAEELLSAVKTRRYTMARLKRILMCALLGIYGSPKEKLNSLYIRVLGAKKESACLLSQLSQKATLPVITQFADTSKLNKAQLALHDTDLMAADIFALGTKEPQPAPFDYSSPLIIV